MEHLNLFGAYIGSGVAIGVGAMGAAIGLGFAIGKSIVNRSSQTNIGELMLEYGGGGHENAGTCQVPNDKVDTCLRELALKITSDG